MDQGRRPEIVKILEIIVEKYEEASIKPCGFTEWRE
jgi:hypothetical protein